jgi:hypothetical protein
MGKFYIGSKTGSLKDQSQIGVYFYHNQNALKYEFKNFVFETNVMDLEMTCLV